MVPAQRQLSPGVSAVTPAASVQNGTATQQQLSPGVSAVTPAASVQSMAAPQQQRSPAMSATPAGLAQSIPAPHTAHATPGSVSFVQSSMVTPHASAVTAPLPAARSASAPPRRSPAAPRTQTPVMQPSQSSTLTPPSASLSVKPTPAARSASVPSRISRGTTPEATRAELLELRKEARRLTAVVEAMQSLYPEAAHPALLENPVKFINELRMRRVEQEEATAVHGAGQGKGLMRMSVPALSSAVSLANGMAASTCGTPAAAVSQAVTPLSNPMFEGQASDFANTPSVTVNTMVCSAAEFALVHFWFGRLNIVETSLSLPVSVGRFAAGRMDAAGC